MDQSDLLEVLGRIAGIGGIALGVVLLIFRGFIQKEIFPKLSQEHSYKLFRLIIIFTFIVGIVGLLLWFLGDRYLTRTQSSAAAGREGAVEWSSLPVIQHMSFDFPPVEGAELYADYWPVGEFAPWKANVLDGIYCIENETAPSDIYYMDIRSVTKPESNENIYLHPASDPIEIDVKVTSSGTQGLSGTGLLYRFSQEAGAFSEPRYYVYMRTAANKVEFWIRRDGGNFGVLYSKELDEIDKDNYITLGIMGNKDRLYLYVNKKIVQTIKDDSYLSGAAGVVFVGKGRFCVDNFTIYGSAG